MFALSLRFAAERLPIGDFGFGRLRVHAELACQTSDHDLEMALPQAADEGLRQLAVVLVMERRILLVQLVQTGRQLVLFSPLFHFHRHRDHRLRERNLRQHETFILGRERVVRVGIAQLRDHANVAGMQLRHLDPLFPDRDAQVIQLFRGFPRRIPDILSVLDRP